MTWISTENSIKCTTVRYMTKDEEQALRDSDMVKYRARMISKGIDLEKKKYMPWRLVNGIPQPECNERKNEALQDSGLCLLDFDRKDSRENHYMNVWKLLKPHLNDWHIVHFEQSLRSGCHATVRVPEGLSRKQTIRLFELRTGLPIDHLNDLARACFLVPNEYVIHETPEYYSAEPLAPVPLTDEDKLMIEKDEEEQRIKMEQKRQETRAKLKTVMPEDALELQTDNDRSFDFVLHMCDIIDNAGIDLTYSYERWYKLAFCLANEFGEQGRNLFHRFSHHHPNYNFEECDTRYTEQLRNTQGGITLGSFIYWLREDGVMG